MLVHGSNHTGMTYETTPDGREGWATWFVRQGHPVYVVDHSGRGRSGFNPTPVNAVRDGGADPKTLPTFFLGPHRARLVEFPVRSRLSEAISRSAVPAGGARPVSRAARAKRGNHARGRRRQHRGRARRAARPHRPRGRHGALPVGHLRARRRAQAAESRAGARQHRRRLRDVHAGRRDAVREGAVRLGVGRQQRRRERRQRRQAARGLRAGG